MFPADIPDVLILKGLVAWKCCKKSSPNWNVACSTQAESTLDNPRG
jgi:hypothetical protein